MAQVKGSGTSETAEVRVVPDRTRVECSTYRTHFHQMFQFFKLGYCENQIRALRVKTGQYRRSAQNKRGHS